jgi:hypothetical protein
MFFGFSDRKPDFFRKLLGRHIGPPKATETPVSQHNAGPSAVPPAELFETKRVGVAPLRQPNTRNEAEKASQLSGTDTLFPLNALLWWDANLTGPWRFFSLRGLRYDYGDI